MKFQVTINGDNLTVKGPQDYLNSQGWDYLGDLLSGKNETFNNSWHYSPDYATALAVHLQTDYARYIGEQQINKHHKN